MLLKDNQKRALKGFVEGEIINSKKLYYITGFIFVGFLAALIIIDIIMLLTGQQSSSNGGALTTGFGIVIILMFISAITMAVGKEIKTAFIFPIDRKTYVLGNFIMFVFNIVGLLLLTSIAFILEFVVFKILTAIYDKIIYVNIMSLEIFLSGFWISFCYILALTTFTYFIFMLFTRFKFKAVVIFCLGAGLPVIFAFGRDIYVKIVVFLVGEESIILLSLKLLAIAIVFQFLSYLTMRKLEVNN